MSSQRRYCVEIIRIACAKQEMDIRTGVAHTLACLLQDDRLQHNTLRRQNNKLPHILLIWRRNTISYPTFDLFCVFIWPYRNAIVKLPICTIHDYIHSNQQKEGAWLGRADLLGESSSVVVTTTTTTNRHTRWWGRASGEKVPKTIAGAIWGGCRIE